MGRQGDDGGGGRFTRLASGFRGRTMPLAGLATRLGARAVGKALSLGGRGGGDEAAAIALAERLVDQLGEMKGLVMKLGQMASYLDGAMPPAAQKVLAKLQARSEPMAFGAVARVVEAELGRSLAELFDAFDEEPFAAASIGQVHRAVFEGAPVAVKVQYPGIEDALRTDLRSLGAATRLATAMVKVDGAGLVSELRERMLAECDYVAEAANQRLYAELLAPIDGASVPAVVAARSARRVLTSELVERLDFQTFAATASQEARDRAAATIFRVSFDTIFRHGVLNGDPHPGNYLLSEDGEVTFLDFGCVKRFEPAFVDGWKRIARSVLEGDRPAFRAAMLAAGMVAWPRRFDWDAMWEVIQYLYKPFLERDPFFRFDAGYVSRSWDVLMWENPNRLRLDMPAEWLFTNRLQWGLFSVLAQLRATGPWPDLWADAVYSATVAA